MKFKISKAELVAGLQRVQNVVGIRTTLPILSNVLVSLVKNQLSLCTTDLDVTMQAGVEAEGEKDGTTTLPVRRLSGIVKELPDAPVEIDVDDKDSATIRCGSSFFKIMGLAAGEFPARPDLPSDYAYHFEQRVFREMLRWSEYAASRDETRPMLNGVLLSFRDGKLTVVATDGRRLALVEQEIDFPKDAEREVILPTKAVKELLATLGDEGGLKLYAGAKQAVFEYGSTRLGTKLIEGVYPNFRQVIPAQCQERIAVNREELLTALRRVALLTNDKSNAAKLTFAKNKLVILTSTPDVGEARETVTIKYSGKEVSVAFNPEFMMDPLRVIDTDEVALELTDELSPGVIKCSKPFLYVLMPMRLT